MRIPRSRGAVSGLTLMLLGGWGALAPLIGPAFDFSTDSTTTWAFTDDTLLLSVLPGLAALLGGLLLLTSAHRATAGLGAWLGLAAGAWLVGGDQITGLSVSAAGEFEHLAAFEGLGAAIAAVAAFALGRLSVRGVRDEALAHEDRATPGADPQRPGPARGGERFEREAQAPAARAGNDVRSDTLTAAERVRQVTDERRGRDSSRGG